MMKETGENCPGCGWDVMVDSRQDLKIEDAPGDWWASDGDGVYCGQTGRLVGHVSVDRESAEVILYDHVEHVCSALEPRKTNP